MLGSALSGEQAARGEAGAGRSKSGRLLTIGSTARRPDTTSLYEVPAHGVIRRERLLSALRHAFQKRLTLVCAPAGAGKTVALAQVFQEVAGPAAWVSLGSQHADVGAFVLVLFDEISRQFSNVAQRGLGTRPLESGFSVDGVAGEFAMWARRVVTQDTLVVLDDFHLVDSSASVRKVMTILLEQCPRTLRFVISSRRPLTLDLSRLRLVGDVCELDPEDFAFSDDEIEALARALGTSLPPDFRNELAEVTEGWAAGIVLALYAFRTRKAGVHDIARLGRLGLRHAWDYMAAQVLEGLDQDTKDFLAAVSILDAMDPDFCDALVSTSASGRIFEGLVSSGMFTYRIPGPPVAYRFHHLLRELLRERLRRSGRLNEFMLRAGELYRERGGFAEAVPYFLEVGKFDDAAACALCVARHMLKTGRHESLRAWLDRIPPEVLTRFPALLVAQGNICEAQGRWDQADARYREAAALCTASGDREGLYQALWWSAGIAWRRGDFKRCLDLCNQALACLPDARKHERGGVHNLIAVAHFGLGMAEEGRRHLQEALRLQQEAGDPWGTGWVLNNLGYHVYMVQGDLEAAMSAYERALGCFEQAGSFPGMAHIKGNMAYALTLKGDYERALSLLAEAEAIARDVHEARTIAAIQILRGQLLVETGDIEGARASIGQATPVVEELREPFLQAFLLSVRSRIFRVAGESARGLEFAQAAAACVGGTKCDPSALALAIDLGAALLDSGDFEGARAVLTDLLAFCRRVQAHMAEAWSLLLLAAAEFAVSDDAWHAHLSQSIIKIASGGYWHILKLAPQTHGVLDAFVRGRLNLELIEVLRKGCHPSLYSRLFAGDRAGPAPGPGRTPAAPASLPDDRPGRSITIQMLGGFRVTRGEQVLTDEVRKVIRVKSLLKYLVANADRWVPRDEILEALWPDKSPKDALNNFNVTLHALRRLLEPTLKRGTSSQYIRTQAGSYRFNPSGGYTLDVEEFERLCEQAQALDSSGRSTESIAVYRAAAEKYAGDFLPEDVYEAWTAPRREALKQSFIRVLLRLGNLLLERNLLAEAAVRARQAIKADPWREDAHRLLMTALARAGQRAKALQHYYSMEEAFLAEFGVGPEEETVRLFERISAGGPV
ncbi:MAG: tetratricopeptide repeat protein [Firmicutes bacterium]|nr:tetratricopeptide repeat protein [Bacillota bacterium]